MCPDRLIIKQRIAKTSGGYKIENFWEDNLTQLMFSRE